MTSLKYVVQNTWDEDEDQELRDYLKGLAADNGSQKSNVNLSYLTKEEILQLSPSPDTVMFVDSSLVQTLLQRKAINVIDTYPAVFGHLYKRRITKTTLSSAEKMDFPYFVKLQGSDKNFAARVVHTSADHNALLEAVGSNTPVYLCDVVDFVAEFRLFLSPGRVWAVCEYSEYMIGHRLLNQAPTPDDNAAMAEPLVIKDVSRVPPDFIEQVLEASKPLNAFCVVDVGLSGEGVWSVVECNPAFALSSYDLDIQTYVEYCTQAWKHMFTSTTS
jgi:hypothetical protein